MGNLSFSSTDREAPTPDNKEENLQTESPTQHISVRMTTPGSKQDWITGLCLTGIFKITWEKTTRWRNGPSHHIAKKDGSLCQYSIKPLNPRFMLVNSEIYYVDKKKADLIWKWLLEISPLKQKLKDIIKIKKDLGLWGEAIWQSETHCQWKIIR